MLIGAIDERERARARTRIRRRAQVPAGEHARRGIHIVFGVVADAAREELHQLAPEVFLRPRLRVRVAVEPDEHRRIPRDRDEQIAKAAERIVAKEFQLAALAGRILGGLRRHQPRRVLAVHLAGDLRKTGGEVVVPEKRHLLLQRPVGMHHPEQQPLPRIIGHGVRRKLAARRGVDVAGLADVRIDRVGNAGVVDQPIDGLRVRQLRVRRELRAVAAEPRSPQQMFDQPVGHPRPPLPLDRAVRTM